MTGRVRLEAFENFLQELPMSRSCAVMVIHFVLKDKSSNESANLSEVIEAYSSDRGWGMRNLTVELNFICVLFWASKCPRNVPIPMTLAGKNFLIGVVVWRRAHTSGSMISPNSSSHYKHSSKKQPVTPLSNRVQDSLNAETNTHSRTPPPAFSESQRQTEEDDSDNDDDDDIPPGFGPRATAQPVPESNFSGDLNPSMPRISPQNLHHGATASQHPVEQMRDLIKRYGQIGTSSVNSSSWADDKNLGFDPWNDDNDNDIPEWRPEASHQPHKQQRYPVVRDHRMQVPMPPTNNQQFAPTATHQ